MDQVIILKILLHTFTWVLLLSLSYFLLTSTERYFQGKSFFTTFALSELSYSISDIVTKVRKFSKSKYSRTIILMSVISFVLSLITIMLIPFCEDFYLFSQITSFEIYKGSNTIVLILVLALISSSMSLYSAFLSRINVKRKNTMETVYSKQMVNLLFFLTLLYVSVNFKIYNFEVLLDDPMVILRNSEYLFEYWVTFIMSFLCLLSLYIDRSRYNEFKSYYFQQDYNVFKIESLLLNLAEININIVQTLLFVLIFIMPYTFLSSGTLPYSLGPFMYIVQYVTLLFFWILISMFLFYMEKRVRTFVVGGKGIFLVKIIISLSLLLVGSKIV